MYRPEFITANEEAELVSYLQDLPLERSMSAQGYEAKRRVFNFGWGHDFSTGKLIPGSALPPFLQPVARRIAKWLDIPKARVAEALVSEYEPGAAIGWHRDNEGFESIVGISLSGWATLRLRPLKRRGKIRSPNDVVSLEVEPRSAYLMQKESRWEFQHSVAKTRNLRYSITFRTLPASVRLPKR